MPFEGTGTPILGGRMLTGGLGTLNLTTAQSVTHWYYLLELCSFNRNITIILDSMDYLLSTFIMSCLLRPVDIYQTFVFSSVEFTCCCLWFIAWLYEIMLQL